MTGPLDLSGRVALITGADGGIGRATARLFAAAGAELILTSNDEAGCLEVARDLGAERPPVVIAADLADKRDTERLIEQALSHAGRIDILVCNAGVEGHVGPIGQASEDMIDRVLTVNLRSAMTLTAGIAPGMAQRGRGSVVLVSSIAGLRGNKAIGLYAVSKAGLAQLGRNLAVEWGPAGVRVNTISPGLTRTRFAAPILEDADYLPRRLQATPLRRAGEPEEIAAAILFLASEAASFVTGHNLVVDGGTTISDGA